MIQGSPSFACSELGVGYHGDSRRVNLDLLEDSRSGSEMTPPHDVSPLIGLNNHNKQLHMVMSDTVFIPRRIIIYFEPFLTPFLVS